jgi:hypothetical protein
VGRVSLAIVAVAVFCTGASAAVTPPTGDKKAIAFYKHEAHLYAMLPGAEIVETGYFFGRPFGSSVDYVWGRPGAAGYIPQKATIAARLTGGQIVAYLATLTAPKLRHVRILMAGTSVFVSTVRCWNERNAASSPLGTGESFLFNDGGAHFLPLVKNGGSTTATFTYTWTPGAQARETDIFSAGPRPTVKITIEVTGTKRMTIARTITPLIEAPALPVPSPPALPVPKRLCGSR